MSLLEKGVPLESVAVLLGNTIKIAEKHYAPGLQPSNVAFKGILVVH